MLLTPGYVLIVQVFVKSGCVHTFTTGSDLTETKHIEDPYPKKALDAGKHTRSSHMQRMRPFLICCYSEFHANPL